MSGVGLHSSYVVRQARAGERVAQSQVRRIVVRRMKERRTKDNATNGGNRIDGLAARYRRLHPDAEQNDGMFH